MSQKIDWEAERKRIEDQWWDGIRVNGRPLLPCERTMEYLQFLVLLSQLDEPSPPKRWWEFWK